MLDNLTEKLNGNSTPKEKTDTAQRLCPKKHELNEVTKVP